MAINEVRARMEHALTFNPCCFVGFLGGAMLSKGAGGGALEERFMLTNVRWMLGPKHPPCFAWFLGRILAHVLHRE